MTFGSRAMLFSQVFVAPWVKLLDLLSLAGDLEMHALHTNSFNPCRKNHIIYRELLQSKFVRAVRQQWRDGYSETQEPDPIN